MFVPFLAIRFEKLIREGVVENQGEIARLGYVSRPRVTQIMNLLNLAPEIQEEILFLPRVMCGKDRVHLRGVFPVSGESDWARQMKMWTTLMIDSYGCQ